MWGEEFFAARSTGAFESWQKHSLEHKWLNNLAPSSNFQLDLVRVLWVVSWLWGIRIHLSADGNRLHAESITENEVFSKNLHEPNHFPWGRIVVSIRFKVVSSFRLHKNRVFGHKSIGDLEHLLLEWPLLDLVKVGHPPAEWVRNKVVKCLILYLLLGVSEFEVLLLVHLLVEKHQRLGCIVVLHVFCHLSNVLVGVRRAAVEFVNVVVVVSCHEEC